jgi:Domain of unknown function (DUF4398)
MLKPSNLPSTTPRAWCARSTRLNWVALGSVFFFAACASVPAPTEQMAVSTAAVANAVSAGGPEWAAADMRMAREKLDRANAAMTTKDYASARTWAHEAQVDAQVAAARARSNKAQKAADVMQEDSRVLREELDRKAKASTAPIAPRN